MSIALLALGLAAAAAAPAPPGSAPAGEESRVKLLEGSVPFALDPGFVEFVPGVPISAQVSGAKMEEELILEVVRVGPLGKGRTRLAVSVDGTKRVLSVLATTLEEHPVGKVWASKPVRQRLPLPPGPGLRRALVVVVAEDPIALRVSLGPRPPDTEIALEPLNRTDAPGTDVVITESAPADDAAPPPGPKPPEPPVDAASLPAPPPPVPPDSTAGNGALHFSVELRAGASAVASGLQGLVPTGGLRLLAGSRTYDAALGLAADLEGQGISQEGKRWDAKVARVRLEGRLGVMPLPILDATLSLVAGAGARLAWHQASAPGAAQRVFVLGATVRTAPELSIGAGPGRLTAELPVDVCFDAPGTVRNFAPLAGGMLVGYRLEL